jgi:hypothetical protein
MLAFQRHEYIILSLSTVNQYYKHDHLDAFEHIRATSYHKHSTDLESGKRQAPFSLQNQHIVPSKLLLCQVSLGKMQGHEGKNDGNCGLKSKNPILF